MASKVTFQNNIINADDMVGGYSSWEFVPNGARVAPANQITHEITLPATTFNAYKPDGNFDLYQPELSVDYSAKEEVVLTGPNNGKISMKGKNSGKTSTWQFQLKSNPTQ